MGGIAQAMKYFVIPIILWGYIISAVLAKETWSVAYGRLVESFHWSWRQAVMLLFVQSVLVGSIGALQVCTFIRALRKREMMTVSQHVGSSLCISAASLCYAAAIVCLVYIIRLPSQ